MLTVHPQVIIQSHWQRFKVTSAYIDGCRSQKSESTNCFFKKGPNRVFFTQQLRGWWGWPTAGEMVCCCSTLCLISFYSFLPPPELCIFRSKSFLWPQSQKGRCCVLSRKGGSWSGRGRGQGGWNGLQPQCPSGGSRRPCARYIFVYTVLCGRLFPHIAQVSSGRLLICCQVPPPMQSYRVTQVILNDLSTVHVTPQWFPQSSMN